MERVTKDELFLPGETGFGKAFTIDTASLGYIHDFARLGGARVGLGASVTAYRYPATLQATYGTGPVSVIGFFRVRL